MTFSTKVKNEIINSSLFVGNELAFLCGIILSAGSIVITGGQMSFNITSENLELLKLAKKLILKMFPASKVELTSTQTRRKTLSLDPSNANDILFNCGILTLDEQGRINLNLTGDSHLKIEREGKLAYLAGMFLGGGSISVPSENSTGGYHMEWGFSSEIQAQDILEILGQENIFAKKVERGQECIVYIKGGEQICTAVGLMGASISYLTLENKLVDRQMRNLVNRQSNCINANIDKAVSAGLKQVESINLISSLVGLDSLPASLKQAATARLNNPEATLLELAENLNISKSAVNLRLRKLMEIANNLGETND